MKALVGSHYLAYRSSRIRTAFLSLHLALVLALAAPVLIQAQALDAPTLIVVVRHTERAGPSADDPGLTEIGAHSARDLARLLADAGITRVHSSDTRRTRQTAAPLAGQAGLEIELHDNRDLEGFTARLLTMSGRHLVVGHSNTTDEMSVLLGGATHGEIVEEGEYDRLYFLTPRPGGGMETVMIRFGPVPKVP